MHVRFSRVPCAQGLSRDAARLAILARPLFGCGRERLADGRVLEIAALGLRDRARLNSSGDSEDGFLDPLRDVVASGQTFADRLLERYHGKWGGDVSKVYGEYSF